MNWKALMKTILFFVGGFWATMLFLLLMSVCIVFRIIVEAAILILTGVGVGYIIYGMFASQDEEKKQMKNRYDTRRIL